MPEETETEQVEQQPQEPDTADEAAATAEEPFDADRAKKALSKKNSENENLRRRLRELEPLAAKARELEDAQKSEAERLTEQLAAERERAATATRSAVSARVEALAARTFADPEDAAGALDLTAYIDESGAIDTDRIQADLDDLLKRKPHWARPDDSGPRRPAPDRTQGSSGNGSRTPSDPGAVFGAFMNQALERGR
ncbi:MULTISPECIES: hypothetical protein [unclassified Streptomyces]|uniref:hypothetical protein n=1 Tax=unclassified Streptomyces TaxID=2593676 RepID=UPI001F1A9911|nr:MULTISPECIES: hypothetical protein [unclassified Streptomyces]